MSRLILIVVTVGLLSTAFGAPLLADPRSPDLIVDESTLETTRVSGFRSGGNRATRQPGNDAILTGVGVGEPFNNPCYVELSWLRQNEDEDRKFATRFWQQPCDGDRPGGYGDVKVSSGVGIAGIEVCTNDRENERLKGARLSLLRDITATGNHDLPSLGLDPEFARLNCRQWHPPASCSSGKIAVGAELFHDDDGVSGLALICATVRLVEPVIDVPEFHLNTAGRSDTRLSGFSGTPVRVGPPTESNRALQSINVGEVRDHPCVLYVNSYDVREPLVEPPGSVLWRYDESNKCGQTENALDIEVDAFPTDDFRQAHENDLDIVFISGLRVCMNKAGTRIKGLDLEGRRLLVQDSGIAIEDVPLDIDEKKRSLRNCETWKRWARCLDGHIATALNVQYEAGADPRSITGIGLECRRITQSRV